MACRRLVALACMSGLVGLACGDAPPPSEGEGPLAQIERRGYVLEASGAPHLGAADSARIEVRLESKGRFHLADEFPSRLELRSSDEAAVVPATQGPLDAIQHDDDVQRYGVEVTAQRVGTAFIEAELRFGLCEGELCMPKTETLVFELTTQE